MTWATEPTAQEVARGEHFGKVFFPRRQKYLFIVVLRT
jgi:hypothetical protein